jgi:hypothetical protein
MAQFTISGERGGEPCSVTWTDGELSGDAATVEWVQFFAQILEGQAVRLIPHLPTYHDHLSNVYSACALMRRVFKPGTVKQDRPLPTVYVPPGAVI